MTATSDYGRHQLRHKHEDSMNEVTGSIVCYTAKHDNKLIIIQNAAHKNDNKCHFVYYSTHISSNWLSIDKSIKRLKVKVPDIHCNLRETRTSVVYNLKWCTDWHQQQAVRRNQWQPIAGVVPAVCSSTDPPMSSQPHYGLHPQCSPATTHYFQQQLLPGNKGRQINQLCFFTGLKY